MRRHGRRDGNHAKVRDGLRDAGYKVADLGSVGGGIPDLLVKGHGRMMLLEVKDPAQPPSARKLTPAEAAFFAAWGDACAVVLTIEDAIRAMRGTLPACPTPDAPSSKDWLPR